MDSEKISQTYWEQASHADLPGWGTAAKTTGDLHAVQPLFQPTDRILDLGCGWGRMTCALTASGYDVAGVDLSENLIAYAKQAASKSGLQIQFDIGSLLNIPHPDASFDKIICLWGVFNHLLTPADQIQALNEMYRVLEPDGLAFIEMGNGERKKYQQIMAAVGYGHENRIWNAQFKESAPPNVLYIHDRSTLSRLSQQSQFEKYRVKFQNINHKRRIITYLFK